MEADERVTRWRYERGHACKEGRRIHDAMGLPAPWLALPVEDLAHEDASDGRERSVVLGEKQSKLEGDAEDPLANGNAREDAIDQVGGCSAHAPRVAGWADAPPLARERDEKVLAALPATGAKEAVRVDAAREVGAELALHVLRKAAGVPGASFVEEGFEMFGNDLLEERPLGAVLRVANRGGAGSEGHGAAMASGVPSPSVRLGARLRRVGG